MTKIFFQERLTGHIKCIHPCSIRVKEGLLLYCGESEFNSKNFRYVNIHRKGHYDYRKWWEANLSEVASTTKYLLDKKENSQRNNLKNLKYAPKMSKSLKIIFKNLINMIFFQKNTFKKDFFVIK